MNIATEKLEKAIDKAYKDAFEYGYSCGWHDAIKKMQEILAQKCVNDLVGKEESNAV